MIYGTKNLDDLSREETKYLQSLLGVTVDGLMGPETRNAWYYFKKSNHLGYLDLVGTSSLSVLIELNKHGKINWNDFSTKISEFFSVGEVSNYSKDRIVKNHLHQKNALKLATELDKIRKIYGPVIITSWYRPPDVNRRIGGASNSQHILGLAADIKLSDSSYLLSLENYLDIYWQGRMGKGAKTRGFIHLDLGNIYMKIPPIGLIKNPVNKNKVVRWRY